MATKSKKPADRKSRKPSQKRRIVTQVEAPAKTAAPFPLLTVILGILLIIAIFAIASGPIQSPVVTQPLWNVTQVAAAPVEDTNANTANVAPIEVPAQANAQVPHDQHLLNLDPTYRSQGWEAWLRAAGIQFDSSKVESRQPVEAVIKDHVTVTSLVIRATGMKVNWPACITTDRPNEVSTSSETRQYQPDLTNPSVMYTNATLNGQGTVYADCSDWGQLDPTK